MANNCAVCCENPQTREHSCCVDVEMAVYKPRRDLEHRLPSGLSEDPYLLTP